MQNSRLWVVLAGKHLFKFEIKVIYSKLVSMKKNQMVVSRGYSEYGGFGLSTLILGP